jgi:hypothetical protein
VSRQVSRQASTGKHAKRLKTARELALEERLAKLSVEEEESKAELPEYIQKLINGYALRCYHFEVMSP